MSLEQKIVQILTTSRQTLAIAESCSGGLLCQRITDIPGASKCLKYGLIPYSNEAKIRFLGIKKDVLAAHGAVSEPVATAMARSSRRKFDSDYSLAITGIAGPTGGSRRKPVGLTFIAIATRKETLCLKCQFRGSRKSIKKQASTAALKLLFEFIQ